MGIVAGDGVFGGLVPLTRWLAGQILLADERCLDIARAIILNGLLPARAVRLGPLQKFPAVR